MALESLTHKVYNSKTDVYVLFFANVYFCFTRCNPSSFTLHQDIGPMSE